MTHNLADLVSAAADRSGDAPALLFRDRRLTWSEVETAVAGFAAGLRAAGLDEGDRVALCLPNTPELAVAWFGCLRAGLVAVPVSPGYTAPEIEHLLTDSGARALVVGRRRAHDLAALAQRLSVPVVVVAGGGELPDGARAWDAVVAGEAPAVTTARGGEDLAALLYTSGTSGRPKGAMLSHRALLANLEQGASLPTPPVRPGSVVLVVLPMFHVYALNAGLGAVAREAATALLVERFDPLESLQLVRAHGVTTVLGAPPLYVAWSMVPGLAEAFAGVEVALSGAAPLPPEVQQRVAELTGVGVHEGYGLTESSPVLTSTLVGGSPVPGSIGRPLPGVELRLLDHDGSQVRRGDPGEIVVRGANLFSGYWPDGEGGPDADGWWPTGDIGVTDDDGNLRLVDRARDLILVSGFNVYPQEVEQVLAAMPGITEAAVVGIPHPYTGEAVKAIVVADKGITVDEVEEWAATRLARFKCPTSVSFVVSLPHSVTGKVSRARLRDSGLSDAGFGAPPPLGNAG